MLSAHSSRSSSSLAILLASCIAFAAPAAAQVTGAIAGTIKDASGAVLPGVTVTVTGPALQRASATAQSSSDGTYRVALLPPGIYDVKFELAGFTAVSRRAIDVAINQQTTVDASLAVGGLTESVDVSGATPLVEVNRSDLTSRVTSRTIDALPLNGRNFVDLVGLAPGARPVPEGQQGANVSIFGERGSAVSFLVDGADNNDPLNGGASLRYTQDSIREFEVITTGYEAEFGRAQGGVVNIATRSGTNDLDGRAFWFRRDDALDSSNVEGQEPPALGRNQWGGTLGGPVKRNKAFFFGSFERLDETRAVNIDRSKIPAFVQSGIATPGGVEDFGVGPDTGAYTLVGKFDYTINNAQPPHHHRQRQRRERRGADRLAGRRHAGAAERGRHVGRQRLRLHRTRDGALRTAHVPREHARLYQRRQRHEHRSHHAIGAAAAAAAQPGLPADRRAVRRQGAARHDPPAADRDAVAPDVRLARRSPAQGRVRSEPT